MASGGLSEAPEADVLVPLSPMDAILASYDFAVLYVFPSPADGCGTMDAQKLETSFQALVDGDYRFFIGELQVDAASGRVSVLQAPEARRLGAEASASSKRRAMPSRRRRLWSRSLGVLCLGNWTRRRRSPSSAPPWRMAERLSASR
jgi:hypothetical protein